MSNADRIEKFYADQITVLSAYGRAKVSAEIAKLKQWLLKHQDETVPDGAKSKIVSILERYNRAQGNFADIRNNVIELFSDYLQLPEGKLLSAKDKSKVLKWLQDINTSDVDAEEEGGGGGSSAGTGPSATLWTVESIDPEKRTITLLSTEDDQLWKENLLVDNAALFSQIQKGQDGDNTCIVEMDESGVVIKLVSN